MCCGALIHARVQTLIFGTREPRSGAVISASQTLDNPLLNHRVQWQEGLEEQRRRRYYEPFSRRGGSQPVERSKHGQCDGAQRFGQQCVHFNRRCDATPWQCL